MVGDVLNGGVRRLTCTYAHLTIVCMPDHSSSKPKRQTTIKCRSCNHDLVKGSPECVKISVGHIAGMESGYEDWDEKTDPWGYMHLKCFYLVVGDPRAVSSVPVQHALSSP